MNIRSHELIVAPALALAFTAGAWSQEPAGITQPRDSGVGRIIALQANRALAEIRRDLRETLHRMPPAPLPAPVLAVHEDDVPFVVATRDTARSGLGPAANHSPIRVD